MLPVIKIQAFKRILQWQLKQHTKYNWQETWRTEWQLCHCPERNMEWETRSTEWEGLSRVPRRESREWWREHTVRIRPTVFQKSWSERHDIQESLCILRKIKKKEFCALTPSGGTAGVEVKIKKGTPFKMEQGRPEGSCLNYHSPRVKKRSFGQQRTLPLRQENDLSLPNDRPSRREAALIQWWGSHYTSSSPTPSFPLDALFITAPPKSLLFLSLSSPLPLFSRPGCGVL